MLGPLPLLHRAVLAAVTFCAGVAAGAWIGRFTPLPVAEAAGALIGGMVGLVGAYALLLEPQPRLARAVRRR